MDHVTDLRINKMNPKNSERLPVLYAADSVVIKRAYDGGETTFGENYSRVSDLAHLYSQIIDENASRRIGNMHPHHVMLTERYFQEKLSTHESFADYDQVDIVPGPVENFHFDGNLVLQHKETGEHMIVMFFDPNDQDHYDLGYNDILKRATINTQIINQTVDQPVSDVKMIGITSRHIDDYLSETSEQKPLSGKMVDHVIHAEDIEAYETTVALPPQQELNAVFKDLTMTALNFMHEHILPMVKPEMDDFVIEDPEEKALFDRQNDLLLTEYAENNFLLKAIAEEISSIQGRIGKLPVESDTHEALRKKPEELTINGPAFKANPVFRMNKADVICDTLSACLPGIKPENFQHSVVTEENVLDDKALKFHIEEKYGKEAFNQLKNITKSLSINSRQKTFKEGGYGEKLSHLSQQKMTEVFKAFDVLNSHLEGTNGADLETNNPEELGYGQPSMG